MGLSPIVNLTKPSSVVDSTPPAEEKLSPILVCLENLEVTFEGLWCVTERRQMESQKKKKGQNQRKSPVSLTDRGRKGVKFVTVGDEIGDEENGKHGKLKIFDEENGKRGKLKTGDEENGKRGKLKTGDEESGKPGKLKVRVGREGRSVSPLPRSSSSSSQKDNKHVTEKAHGLTPALASKAIDAIKPPKKTQCQTDPTRTALKLAPVTKTVGLLKSPAKVATAKTDSSRQGSRRTSLTSTKKPKIKIKRSKTEDDNAEEDHQEEKRKQEKRSLDIRLPEIIIDVPRDNIEELENASAAMLLQNLQTAHTIPEKQVSLAVQVQQVKEHFVGAEETEILGVKPRCFITKSEGEKIRERNVRD